MGLEYEFTTDVAALNTAETPLINYSNQHGFGSFHISPASLLFETDIAAQSMACSTFNGNKVFFKTAGKDFPFDIFAASFYLISRYEEYLPHEKDKYGRYAHENSFAFKEEFLQTPLINKWLIAFAAALQQHFPGIILKFPLARFQPTYDIDIAYSFLHKGLARNTGGFLKQPSLQRIRVLLGKEKDPFDVYDWLDTLHLNHQLKPVYFFLVAKKNGLYDKNILPSTTAMQQLIQHHAKKYTIGIHPSWQSGDDENLLLEEKTSLEEISQNTISFSRQHYIRFNLPDGYRHLLKAGITDDYSMGYGTVNGFRASIANSFFWYDLQKETTTNLRIHPFCFMDSNCFYKQSATPLKALEDVHYYSDECKKTNGTFISIWHNQFLGTDPLFKGWRQVYEKFIAGL